MAYEQKPGYGSLFKNSFKENDSQPSMRGTVTAHRDIKMGDELEIAGWSKTTQAGDKFLSLKISDKRQQDSQPPQGQSGGNETPPSGSPGDDLDSDIPF